MKRLSCSVAALSIVVATSSANAAILKATAATINSVFMAAKPGDTIKITGKLGRVLLANRSFSRAITIDATQAVFTDTLIINNVKGLNFIGGKYGSSTRTTYYGKAVAVNGGSRISFTNATVVGANKGQGIVFNGTSDVSVSGSSFSKLRSGLIVTGVTRAQIYDNKSFGAVSDGFDIVDSHNIKFTGNACSGSVPAAGAHPDCAQLWSLPGHPVQSDIVIRGNTATGATQGFTSFTPANGGGLRITIIHNTVNTSYPQGIACYACVDSTISSNVLTTLPGALHKTSINVVGGRDNIVRNNSIGALPSHNAGVTVASLAKVDAAATLTHVSSAARELTTGAVSAVPEPQIWATMMVGFGLLGAAMRRRPAVVAA